MPLAVQLETYSPKQPLQRAVTAFNFSIVDYSNIEKLRSVLAQTYEDSVLDRLLATPRLHHRLSIKILEILSIRPIFDFSPALRQLALLDQAALHRIARHVGGLIYAPTVVRIISGPAIAKLKGEIGVDAYDYARKQGELGGSRDREANVEYNDLGSAIEHAGWRSLAAWLTNEPDEIIARVLLKFPPGSELERSLSSSQNDGDLAALTDVLRTGDERWRNCCP